jgi:hypothetical protein
MWHRSQQKQKATANPGKTIGGRKYNEELLKPTIGR